jgi:hypothetical protein
VVLLIQARRGTISLAVRPLCCAFHVRAKMGMKKAPGLRLGGRLKLFAEAEERRQTLSKKGFVSPIGRSYNVRRWTISRLRP